MTLSAPDSKPSLPFREPEIGGKWTLRLLWGGLVASGIVFALWSWSAYRSYQVLSALNERNLRQGQLHGRILLLDEVLTMSARMRPPPGIRNGSGATGS